MTLNSAVTTDIDIDFADRDSALMGLMHVAASMKATNAAGLDTGDKNKRHPSGVYFQDVPVDPLTGFCSLPYKDAAESGYFKIDFLNNSLYKDVRDDDHLTELVNREPDWGMLKYPELVKMLAHIGQHFGIVQIINPCCVEDLAIVLALMRPGKKHLLMETRKRIDEEIWLATDEGFTFKKAHAIAYAVSIVVQMNLIYEKAAQDIEEQREYDETVWE